MGKVKPLPLFGDEAASQVGPTAEAEDKPRKARTKREASAPAMLPTLLDEVVGLPLLLVRTAEADAAGVRRAAEFVAAAVERGWDEPYAVANLGAIGAAETALYVAAKATGDAAIPLLGGLLLLRTGEEVAVKGKREAMPATPLLLIAVEERGWASLRQLQGQLAVDLDALHRHGAGLAAISLGWAAMTLQSGKKEQLALNRTLMVVQQALGRLYLGVDASEAHEAAKLRKAAGDLGLPLLATHIADYIDADDEPAFVALCQLNSVAIPSTPRALLSADEARAAFAAMPEATQMAGLTGCPPLPTAPLTPPVGDLAALQAVAGTFGDELAAIDAVRLTFGYNLAGELADYARERGFEVRVGAGQGADGLAWLLGAGAVPPSLPNSGAVSANLCLEYPPAREGELLGYVAKRYADHACLLLPPSRTSLRTAVHEAARVTRASEDALHRLLREAHEGKEWPTAQDEGEATLLAIARKLLNRPRIGERGTASLLITAAPLSDALPLETETGPALSVLRLSRTAARQLGAVRIDLSPSPALDLLDQLGVGNNVPTDDATTLALLQAGEADDIDGGGKLPAAESLAQLAATLATAMEVESNDANAACRAWDNYRLAYAKAHQLARYFAVAAAPLGLHPLAAHAPHWHAAIADGRLFGSGQLPAAGKVGRALGLVRGLRRLADAAGNTFVAASLHDLQGELTIFAYPPIHDRLSNMGEGRLLLTYGTLLASDGRTALLVEHVSSYEGGEIGPLSRIETRPANVAPSSQTTERNTTTPVNRPSNSNTPARSGARDNRQPPKNTTPPPSPPDSMLVRRLYLRLPVTDDADTDIDTMHQIADIAKRNSGYDVLTLFLHSGNYEVRLDPHGMDVDADSFKRELTDAIGFNPIFEEDQIEITP